MITYGKNGYIRFSTTWISHGKVLMSYIGRELDINDNGLMIRPKFVFYRILNNS